MSKFYERAMTLRSRGYTVVPIQKGSKAPGYPNWQNHELSDEEIYRKSLNGYADGNIGINTRHTPAVDIDVLDTATAEAMEQWLIDEFGDTGVRIGRFPKRLLVYRTDKPFKKLQATYLDDSGQHQKLEILGEGQQFVAYGVHPDTQKDYEWTSFDQPLDTEVDDLPLLTYEHAVQIIEAFEELCEKQGWTRVSSHHGRQTDEGGLETITPRLSISEDRIVEALDLLDNDEADYDDYLEVGQALHHQFDGGHRGRELWHDWAGRSSKYDAADVDRRYDSFGHGPATKTFRTILMKVKDAKKKAEVQAYESLLNRIDACNHREQLEGEIARQAMLLVGSQLQLEEVVQHIQVRLREVSDFKASREAVRKMLEKQRPKVEVNTDLPSWCENWYYVSDSSSFKNIETGQRLSRTAFGDVNLRFVEEGARPTEMALGQYKLPTVAGEIYMPGAEQLFLLNGRTYLNAFRQSSVPDDREPTTKAARDAIKTVLAHFDLLFPDKRERETLLDFLAYTVQYPIERINWAVLIQGVEGGGKSVIGTMMAAVLGGDNIRNVDASSLKESFTSWAEGSRMVFFEEIRLKSEKKFEIIDRLKPYITNESIPVRRMRTDAYEVPNVTNYVMFTNYHDALPLTDNDRRYFVIKTSLQTKGQLDLLLRKDPAYFERLHAALRLHHPALRYWLLNREISEGFNAKGSAPTTLAREEMIRDSESDDLRDQIEEMIADEQYPWVTDAVLDIGQMRNEMGSPVYGADGKKLARKLMDMGFQKLADGKQIKFQGYPRRFYTRHPEIFEGIDLQEKLRQLLPDPDNPDDGFD